MQTGGAVIDTLGNNVTFSSPMVSGASPDGGLLKLGSGILFLGNTNTYGGKTIVGAGTLMLTNAAILNSTNGIVISNNATLLQGSSAAFQSDVIITINSGGTYTNSGNQSTLGGVTGSGNYGIGGANQVFTLPQSLTFDGLITGNVHFIIENQSSLNTTNGARTFKLTNPNNNFTSGNILSVGGNGSADSGNGANIGDVTLQLGTNGCIPASTIIRIWGSSAANGSAGGYQNTLDMNGFTNTFSYFQNGGVSGAGTKPGLVTNSAA